MGSQDNSESPTNIATEDLLGLLRIRLKRGINLAVRDLRSSDPYVTIKMGNQRMKTRIIKKDINPEWNEDFTLSITDPNEPVLLISICPTPVRSFDSNPNVYDHDTFSVDDSMGDAEFELGAFMDALKLQPRGLPNNTRIKIIQPSRTNCLAEESCVVWRDGQVMQDICLRLRNVECGELQIQLQWIDRPPSKVI